jgi:ketosteroid isomerase-like protein
VSLPPHAQRLLDGRAAYNAGETAFVGQMFAEDGVWHAAGLNAYSGDVRGRAAIGAWFDELFALMDSCVVDLRSVMADDRYVVFFMHLTGRRGELVIDQLHMNAWRFEGQECVEGWFLPDDVAAWDAFVGTREPSVAPLVSRPTTTR